MAQAVVLCGNSFPERTLIADLLARHGGFPPPVAARLAARGAAGIVWESAPPAAAQGVARDLTGAGYPAVAVEQERLPPPSVPRRVHVLKLDGEHLGVQLRYSGPPESILWHDVLVISVGALRKETRKSVVAETALLHGIVVRDERVQTDISRELVAELFARQAGGTQLLHIRLNSHEINYAQTLGGTIYESWREKFSVLIAKLGLRAEQALISPQTEALLAAGMSPENCTPSPFFESEEAFTAYNRWLLARTELL